MKPHGTRGLSSPGSVWSFFSSSAGFLLARFSERARMVIGFAIGAQAVMFSLIVATPSTRRTVAGATAPFRGLALGVLLRWGASSSIVDSCCRRANHSRRLGRSKQRFSF